MNFKRLVSTVSLLAIFTMALRISVTSDTWWHLRAGSWIVENGQLLRQDLFSLTRLGQPWLYPGWLAQIAMIATFERTGFPGLNLFTALSVLIGFAFVWKSVAAPPLLKGFTFVLAAACAGVYWSARPQILSFALTGAWIWALQRGRQYGPRALWVWPALMALWVNLHGGFAVGLLLLAVELISAGLDRITPFRFGIPPSGSPKLGLARIAAGAGASVVAVGLNPNGPLMLAYPFKTVSIGVLQDYIQEWQSPNFHSLELQPFLWMLLLTAAFLALSPESPNWRELLSVTIFAYLGFLAARNIALFALVALPILTRHMAMTLQAWFPSRVPAKQLPARTAQAVNLILLVALVAVAALKSITPLSRSANETAIRDQTPVAAADYLLEARPPGPLLNSYNWGSYVTWALYPNYLSFVDGRTDLFDDEILQEYLELWRADPGWEAIIQRWGLKTALLEPEAPITRALLLAGWRILYEDPQAVVLSES
ncbi:MAG: hypothetical protein ACRDHG_05755 [Anaerolineales bacterium]